jgi:hypothetical protein
MQTPPAPEAAPEAEQVLDGLWSLPVPIPGSPLPHVLAYAFRVPDGVVLTGDHLLPTISPNISRHPRPGPTRWPTTWPRWPGCAAGAATIWEVASRLPWSRPWAEVVGILRRAALGETAAHLAHLERRGRLTRTGADPLRWAVAARA